MTDYNDGKWHEHVGESIPKGVHPKSKVEAFYRTTMYSLPMFGKEVMDADEWDWSSKPSEVCLFRVVKPYREPRVIWVNEYGDGLFAGHVSKKSAEDASVGYPAPLRTAVRYVEQPE